MNIKQVLEAIKVKVLKFSLSHKSKPWFVTSLINDCQSQQLSERFITMSLLVRYFEFPKQPPATFLFWRSSGVFEKLTFAIVCHAA